MKKLTLLAMVLLLVSSFCLPAAAAQKFEAASGTAKIDGVMDDAYLAAPVIKIENYLKGSAKTKGTARVLWDSKNLYIFYDITDPALSTTVDPSTSYIYKSDSVEFFVDLASAPGKLTDINAGQWTAYAPIAKANVGTWGGLGKHQTANKANASYAAKVTEKGWTVEMQIPFGADYSPKAGAVISAVFHINSDEDGAGGRDYEIFAGDAAGQEKAWSSTENYDKLTLTSAKYTAPVKQEPTASPATADAGVLAALASAVSAGAAVILSKKRK